MKTISAYHEVPPEWAANHLIETYARLVKSFHVDSPRNLGVSVVHPLVQARHALHQLSLGIKSNDQACIWLSAQFVASTSYFSGSGYLKAGMARRLKQSTLDEQTKDVIRKGALQSWSQGLYRQDWRELHGLLRHIGLGPYRSQFAATLGSCHLGVRRYVRSLVSASDATYLNCQGASYGKLQVSPYVERGF